MFTKDRLMSNDCDLITYKTQSFTEFDISHIRKLVHQSVGETRDTVEYRTAEEMAFYQKFTAVKGFASVSPVYKDNATWIILVPNGWSLNYAVVSDIMRLHDNPPQEDKWAKWTFWIKSRRWSLPIFLAFIAIPILAKYVEWILLIVNYIIGN